MATERLGGSAKEPRTGELPNELSAALAEFRKSIPATFDDEYVRHVVVPFFLTSIYEGERPALPMIDLDYSKENALPFDLWGLIYKGWEPTPQEGVTVFLQGLEKRGANNLRKKIYFSAMTPDLYGPMYQPKVAAFLDQLMDAQHAGKPFMRHYLDHYFDLYWDLHLGVKGDAIPPEVRQIGESFNTVLAYRNPMQQIVFENYTETRSLLQTLRDWIDARVRDVASGRAANPEKTIAYYWLKNAGDGEHFSEQDIVFECFHNFVALSQWGNTIYGIMSRLRKDGGDSTVRASFEETMSGDYDQAAGSAHTPLQMFVMELFRTISPNGASISTIVDSRQSTFYGPSPFAMLGAHYERHAYVATPHTSTSFDPRYWTEPDKFDPGRYRTVPTSDKIDEHRCKEIGFARCPFDLASLKVADGREVALTNSGFGTVFGEVDGQARPVVDYAGFAPFGFGYRRCPGEQLTISVFEDFLRKVWKDRIEFITLDLPKPGRVPIGPNAVIDDNIGFRRA